MRTLIALACVVLTAAACTSSSPDRPSRWQQLAGRRNSDTMPSRAITPRELQLQLQGYVDVASELYRQAGEVIRQQTTDPLIRLRSRQLSVYPRMAMMQLVSGPDPDISMLDMVVMATLFRMVVEDHWGPEVFKDLRGPVENAARRVEQYIWEIADDVLSPAALTELRSLIAEWRARHPAQRFVSSVRFREFAQLRGLDEGPGLVSGIFRTVNPLSGLRGTTQEIQETRLLAERAMFFFQRMPDLFLSQAQLSLVETLSMPESRELLGHVASLSATTDRLSATAEALPERLGSMLEEHDATTRGLLVELRTTLEVARDLADSTGVTIQAADGLAARFTSESGEESGARAEGEEPLDVKALLIEANRTTAGLNELVVSLDALLDSPAWGERFPQLQSTIERVDQSGADLVELLFRRVAMLVGILLAAALIYRGLSRRLS